MLTPYKNEFKAARGRGTTAVEDDYVEDDENAGNQPAENP